MFDNRGHNVFTATLLTALIIPNCSSPRESGNPLKGPTKRIDSDNGLRSPDAKETTEAIRDLRKSVAKMNQCLRARIEVLNTTTEVAKAFDEGSEAIVKFLQDPDSVDISLDPHTDARLTSESEEFFHSLAKLQPLLEKPDVKSLHLYLLEEMPRFDVFVNLFAELKLPYNSQAFAELGERIRRSIAPLNPNDLDPH